MYILNTKQYRCDTKRSRSTQYNIIRNKRMNNTGDSAKVNTNTYSYYMYYETTLRSVVIVCVLFQLLYMTATLSTRHNQGDPYMYHGISESLQTEYVRGMHLSNQYATKYIVGK